MVQLPVGPSYLELAIHPPDQEALSFPIQFSSDEKKFDATDVIGRTPASGSGVAWGCRDRPSLVDCHTAKDQQESL